MTVGVSLSHLVIFLSLSHLVIFLSLSGLTRQSVATVHPGSLSIPTA